MLNLDITLTEGGKKALCLLSQGHVAIALYGINGGYRKHHLDGTHSLIPDLTRFTTPGRKITLAFDQDAEAATRTRVNRALLRFGGLLTQAGCKVTVAQWDGRDGKGIDDLTVKCGTEAAEAAIAGAYTFKRFNILRRLQGRLTYKVNIKLVSHDLSQVEVLHLPEVGIIAISSPKGTGKTKLIEILAVDADKVLAAGHRTTLMRTLCKRLGLTYRGDADKVNGQFINGSGYALRLGFCVDSLLSIDPAKFEGCDLILDEVVQVVRHLLTSSTCAKEGKRPALLARFKALIQAARRVIIADADLDDDTMHYIQALRDDNNPIFLIHNDFQSNGYPTQFLESQDSSEILGRLLEDLDTLPEDQVIYITTDSKAMSKAIARAIETCYPGRFPTLLINSETSGGEIERAFAKDPHTGLPKGIRIVICSPSLATGMSDETQGRYYKVYGIFTGVSSTDADMSQALSRVREPVARVVWCAKTGLNFSPVSRSTNPLELKRDLLDKTSTTISLLRSGLKADVAGEVERIDWQSDPHIHLWAKIEADRNRSMQNLRESLLVRLWYEGNQVEVQEAAPHPVLKLLLRNARAELKEINAEQILNARILTLAQVLELSSKEGIDADDQRAIDRFWICEFYVIEPDSLTIEKVIADRGGSQRAELRSLEELLYPGVAVDRTVKALEHQMTWSQGICPWDISHAELRRVMRQKINLLEIIERFVEGQSFTQEDYAPYAEVIRSIAKHIKAVLNLTIKDSMSDAQVVNQLLSQLGIRLKRFQSRSSGKVMSRYVLKTAIWQEAMSVLERRQARRNQLNEHPDGAVTPLTFNNESERGVTDLVQRQAPGNELPQGDRPLSEEGTLLKPQLISPLTPREEVTEGLLGSPPADLPYPPPTLRVG